MSHPEFDSTEIAKLRAKINEAKHRLPLPRLLEQLGLAAHAKRTAPCPLHADKHPSFSVFQGENGLWHWKCFAGCGKGDEILFVQKLKGLSIAQAVNMYLEMAGFPPWAALESDECLEFPQCPKSPEPPTSPVFPVYPVSEGQEVEAKVKALAAQNACTQLNTARPRRWKLLQDLKALRRSIKRKLQSAELATAFDEWYRLSLAFLDPAKTRDDYEAKFLSEFAKVRYGTGEGTLATALENVANVSPDQLSVIPGKPNAPESWRRLFALHQELARLRAKPTYFLSYRDAAKVFDGMTHQQAFDITGALFTLGAIEFVSKGKAGLNSRKAAEFRNRWRNTAKAA
jgi:hypothetical protein